MRKDYTQGSIVRHICSLAVPSTGSLALVSFSTLLDAFWLGRLGSTALAAASMGMSLRMVMISLLMGVSIGGSAVVARCVGAQDQRRANRTTLQIIFLVVGIVGFVGIAGYVWAEPLLRLMGAKGEVLTLGVQWVRVIFAGLLFMEMLPSVNQVFYGSGNPERVFQTYVVHLTSLMILEPLLILGWGPVPAMGIRGAGLAQVLASALGVIFQCYCLLAGKARVRMDRQDFGVDTRAMGLVMKLALPTAATRLMMNLADTLTYRLIAPFGVAVIAGFSVVSKVFGFAFTLPGGVALSPRTMVGQNLGAGKPERATRAAWWASTLSAMLAVALMGLVVILAEPIIGLFDANPEVLAEGIRGLHFLAFPQIACTVGYCVSAALMGAGDTISPMWINIASLWIVRLPLMYGLAHLAGWGPVGIWAGMGLAQVIEAVAMAIRFGQGKWRQTEI